MKTPLGFYIDKDEHTRLATKYEPAFERLRAKIIKYVVNGYVILGVLCLILTTILWLIDYPEPINISFWGIE